MNASFRGLSSGIIAAVAARVPADGRQLPVVARPGHHPHGAAGCPGGDRVDALRDADDPVRAGSHGRHHEHRRCHVEQHPRRDLRQRPAQGGGQRSAGRVDGGDHAPAPRHHDRARDDPRHAADVARARARGESRTRRSVARSLAGCPWRPSPRCSSSPSSTEHGARSRRVLRSSKEWKPDGPGRVSPRHTQHDPSRTGTDAVHAVDGVRGGPRNAAKRAGGVRPCRAPPLGSRARAGGGRGRRHLRRACGRWCRAARAPPRGDGGG